jgi:uncharacterized protein involved in exopolysaccharide biosynthesis
MGIEQNKIQQNNSLSDEISLKELFLKIKEWVNYLKSKLKVIFIAGIIGGMIGLAIAWFDKPIYKATLTFAMEEDKSNGGGGLTSAIGLASSFGIDLGGTGGGGAFAASNLAELMKSRLIFEKVLLEKVYIENKNTSLAEYFIEINGLRKNWLNNTFLKNLHFPPNSDRNKFTLQQDSILKKIHNKLIDKENLTILQKDKKVTIVTLEVNSNNELFAKLLCESLAKQTSNLYIETKSKKAQINVNVLQKQVDSIKYELNQAITGVAKETDYVYNMNPAFNINASPSKKKQIDVQANTAILTNLSVQLELAKITLRKETPLIQIIDKPIFPLEKDKIGKINSLILGITIGVFLIIIFLTLDIFYKKYSNRE